MNAPPPGAVSAAPRHLLQQQPSGGLQRAEQDGGVDGVLALPHVLAHLDRTHRIEGLAGVGELTVVLQAHLHAVGEAALGDAFRDEITLLGREGHADRAHAVVLGGVQDQRAPPAPDVEQAHARPQVELAADEIQLGALGVHERLAGVGEVRRGVGHRVVEQQFVEVVRQVVMVGDRGPVASFRVQPAV